MREILFRGQRIDNKEWAYGCLINYLPNKNPRIISFEFFGESQHEPEYKEINYEVIPETVSQFIGLLDKNGNKIFEGDKTNLGIVKYYCGSFIVDNKKGSYYTLLELSNNEETYCDLEIIGNIHDK